MITYIMGKIKGMRSKKVIFKGTKGAYGHMIVISEREEFPDTSYSYSYEQHMKNNFRKIDTFYDMEAVIYTKTGLNCFGYVFHKVVNENYCKQCSNAKEKHIIRIVSSKLIPRDVQKFIKDNMMHSVTEVLFTNGSANIYGILKGTPTTGVR